MRYCLFMGTFNPVHNAHLAFAKKVKEEFKFDKIIFIPAFIQPFKSKEECIKSAKDRFVMLEKAIKNHSYFELSDIEYKKGDTSYTIETIEILYKELSDIEGKINLIIGTDAFKNIFKWYRAEELIKIVNFIVLKRDTDELPKEKQFEKISYNVLESESINISSTQIRNMVKSGEDISEFVPVEVMRYINDNKLYND